MKGGNCTRAETEIQMYNQQANDRTTKDHRAIFVFPLASPRSVAIIVTRKAAKAVDAPNKPAMARAPVNPTSRNPGKSSGTQRTYSSPKTREGKLKMATQASQYRLTIAGVATRSGRRAAGAPSKLLR